MEGEGSLYRHFLLTQLIIEAARFTSCAGVTSLCSTSPSPAVRSVVRKPPGCARCSSASPFPILTSRKCSVKRINPSLVLPSETLTAEKGPRDDMYFLDGKCRSAQEALCDASISACPVMLGFKFVFAISGLLQPKAKMHQNARSRPEYCYRLTT